MWDLSCAARGWHNEGVGPSCVLKPGWSVVGSLEPQGLTCLDGSACWREPSASERPCLSALRESKHTEVVKDRFIPISSNKRCRCPISSIFFFDANNGTPSL